MHVYIPANERVGFFGPKLIYTGESHVTNACAVVSDAKSKNICGSATVVYQFPDSNAPVDIGVMEIVSVGTNPSDPSAGTSYTYQNPPPYVRTYEVLLLGR